MIGGEHFNSLAVRAVNDEKAFEELYTHFFPRVYNFILSRLKNPVETIDVTNTTFFKVCEYLASYDASKASFSTWLFNIANHTLIDLTRSQFKIKRVEWEDFLDFFAPDTDEPEYQLLVLEDLRSLLIALNKLNKRERRIIDLRYWGEHSTHTIAEMLGMTDTNVRVTLHRALNKLRKILREAS